MEAQSSPFNEKPASDLNALFEELEKKQSKKSVPVPSTPRGSSATHALLGKKSRASAPPPPPSLRAPTPKTESLDDAELIEEDDPDATIKTKGSDPILPAYDAELDDAPTIARSSPLSLALPTPSRRPAPPPSSVRLPPPPSLRQSVTPSSIAKLSAPAAPLKSAADLPLPSSRSLPALTPPPASRRSMPVASRPPVPAPQQAVSQPAPSLQHAPLPRASVVVSEPAPATRTPASASIPPVARSDSHSATVVTRRKRSSAGLVAALGAFTAIAALGVGAFVFKDKIVAAAGGAKSGIVVTAAGPNDAPVSGLRVMIDGKEACSASPCRVALDRGTHFVRVEASGFVATADRAVSVDGGEASLHIALTPATAGKAPVAEAAPDDAAKSPKGEKASTPLDLDQAPSGPKPAAAPRSVAKPAAPAKPADKVAAKPADKKSTDKKDAAEPVGPAGGMGTLNINSIPVASVVLDGRPVGSTPIVGLSVSAGPHSVVFVHPDHGRKATGVKVEAGKTATAAVRF